MTHVSNRTAHPQRSLRRSLFVTLWAALSAGCVMGELDVPEITVTRQKLEFPGVAAELAKLEEEEAIPKGLRERPGLPATGEDFALPAQSFSYDDAPEELPEGVSPDLRAKRIVIEARGSKTDLSFVRRLQLTVIRPDAPDDADVLLDYPAEGKPKPPPARRISHELRGDSAAFDPWKAQGSVYELRVWGSLESLPREPWWVDVSMTFEGEIALEY